MAKQDNNWEFYGREDNIRLLTTDLELDVNLSKRIFTAVLVVGRRSIGKTKLLTEMQKKAPNDMPFLIYEIPNPTKPENNLTKVIEEFLDAGGEAGLQHMSDGNFNAVDEQVRFKKVLLAMLKQGATVVLDEFHNADGYGLDSYIKQAIDQARFEKYLYTGKLVMMGSHQQKVLSMFAYDQPLYNRYHRFYRLSQWSLKTTMKVARDYGILQNANKFLTLWTAYGGLPNKWEDYCTLGYYRHLHNIDDLVKWQKGFLRCERDLLAEDTDRRWDNKAYVELQPAHKELMYWLASDDERRTQGVKVEDIYEAFPSQFTRDAVKVLKTHLELIGKSAFYLENDKAWWRITDSNTLFQLDVLKEYQGSENQETPLGEYEIDIPDDVEQETPSIDTVSTTHEDEEVKVEGILERLRTLEGRTLELMAARYLRERRGVKWAEPNVRRNKFGTRDIDILAFDHYKRPTEIWIGNLKRNPKGPKINNTLKHQKNFIKDVLRIQDENRKEIVDHIRILNDNELKRKVGEKKFHRLLISPSFKNLTKRRLEGYKKKFELLDIPVMAKSYDIDLSSSAEPDIKPNQDSDNDYTPPVPEPPKPSLPSFDM